MLASLGGALAGAGRNVVRLPGGERELRLFRIDVEFAFFSAVRQASFAVFVIVAAIGERERKIQALAEGRAALAPAVDIARVRSEPMEAGGDGKLGHEHMHSDAGKALAALGIGLEARAHLLAVHIVPFTAKPRYSDAVRACAALRPNRIGRGIRRSGKIEE